MQTSSVPSEALSIKSQVFAWTIQHSDSQERPHLMLQPHLWSIFPSSPKLQALYPSFSSSGRLPNLTSILCLLLSLCPSLCSLQCTLYYILLV
jgi:hypothetical protein